MVKHNLSPKLIDTYGPTISPPSEVSTCLEIDLKQIKKNYKVLSEMSAKNCGAVLKADSYGLGAGPISHALYEEGCRHFFVASIREGITLRETYFLPQNANIYVFNGVFEKTEELFSHYHLIPVLISLEQIERWAKFAKLHEEKLPAIVHIDTGMARTGLCEKEKKILCKKPELLSPFKVHAIMSHLACANKPTHPHNSQQLKKFIQFIKYFPNYHYSLASSTGIALGSQYHFDLTRPGFGLYGATSFLPKCQLSVRLWARIIQIRSVTKGTYVGYESLYQSPFSQRLATLSIGFANFWSQPKTQQLSLFLHGQKIPILGLGSMDLLVADITHLPEKITRVGDWVELLGPNISLQQAADLSSTTPAKILTSLGQETHYRIYLN